MRILIFSDIHGDRKALERLLAIPADYYFSAGDLVNSNSRLSSMLDLLGPLAGRLGMIPGNHETEAAIAEFCDAHGFDNWHGVTRELGGRRWAALGYSNTTPFSTPGEYTEDELSQRLDRFRDYSPEVVVCHCPPKNTELDRAGAHGHFGSTAVSEFLALVQPQLFFCGHIHESEGKSTQLESAVGNGAIRVTAGRNVGKRGYLLELERF